VLVVKYAAWGPHVHGLFVIQQVQTWHHSMSPETITASCGKWSGAQDVHVWLNCQLAAAARTILTTSACACLLVCYTDSASTVWDC
jgi:hypothetical protein